MTSFVNSPIEGIQEITLGEEYKHDTGSIKGIVSDVQSRYICIIRKSLLILDICTAYTSFHFDSRPRWMEEGNTFLCCVLFLQ